MDHALTPGGKPGMTPVAGFSSIIWALELRGVPRRQDLIAACQSRCLPFYTAVINMLYDIFWRQLKVGLVAGLVIMDV
jgi:hypothetical protein